MIVAGVDVGSRELHLVVRRHGSPRAAEVFTNDAAGFRAIRSRLRQQRVTRLVLEATGVYHLDLALALHEEPGLEVMVLNPKASSRYAEVRMSRSKTDRVDAALLAEYAEHMPFSPWQPPSANILVIRACARRLAALTKQRTQAKNQLHALRSTASTPAFLLEDVELSIAQCEKQIAALQVHTRDLIQADETLAPTFALLLSIKGVAEKSAIRLLGELLVLPTDMRAKQWVAMAGLDPRRHESGSSVSKKARISKVGNRHLRATLYMPALCAARHVPQVKAYYRHLIDNRGLKKIQAVCAVMRKLLHAIHGMFAKHQPFDASRFYHPQNQNPPQPSSS
jgi:transposase